MGLAGIAATTLLVSRVMCGCDACELGRWLIRRVGGYGHPSLLIPPEMYAARMLRASVEASFLGFAEQAIWPEGGS